METKEKNNRLSFFLRGNLSNTPPNQQNSKLRGPKDLSGWRPPVKDVHCEPITLNIIYRILASRKEIIQNTKWDIFHMITIPIAIFLCTVSKSLDNVVNMMLIFRFISKSFGKIP